ncbi:MAG: glutamate 5-kinase [Halomonas sp.]|nr:glutamate 5-kinase [Halomonas sp.]
MGLRDDLQTDIAEAFNEDLADAVTSFTATRTTVSGQLDPVTGKYPETTVAYSGRGVFGGYSVREVDGQHILRTDVKLTALQNEVTKDSDGSAYAPAVDDVLAGYDVMNVEQDPASATWKIQLRRSA